MTKIEYVLDSDILISLDKGKALESFFDCVKHPCNFLEKIKTELEGKGKKHSFVDKNKIEYILTKTKYIENCSSYTDEFTFYVFKFSSEYSLLYSKPGELYCLAYCCVLKSSKIEPVLVSNNFKDYGQCASENEIKFLTLKDVLTCMIFNSCKEKEDIQDFVNNLSIYEPNANIADCLSEGNLHNFSKKNLC